ncbi:MAG: AraC family transcriptional regulator, partial [Flavitalea sp.]
SIRKNVVEWKTPEKILCHYDYPPGLFTRATLHNSLDEYIKGAGEVHLDKEQFFTLAGSDWKSVLVAQHPGDYEFIDACWSASFLQELLKSDPSLTGSVDQICHGCPERIIMLSGALNNTIIQMLSELQQNDFSAAAINDRLHVQMKKYLSLITKPPGASDKIRKDIKPADWQHTIKAKELIDANPDKHFTIPEISKIVGLNEFKLKKIFRKLTGFSIDEYRKYILCTRAAKKIIQEPDKPLKHFAEMAGYNGLTNFVRGFRKLCYCTPGELRMERWDFTEITRRGILHLLNFLK